MCLTIVYLWSCDWFNGSGALEKDEHFREFFSVFDKIWIWKTLRLWWKVPEENWGIGRRLQTLSFRELQQWKTFKIVSNPRWNKAGTGQVGARSRFKKSKAFWRGTIVKNVSSLGRQKCSKHKESLFLKKNVENNFFPGNVS